MSEKHCSAVGRGLCRRTAWPLVACWHPHPETVPGRSSHSLDFQSHGFFDFMPSKPSASAHCDMGLSVTYCQIQVCTRGRLKAAGCSSKLILGTLPGHIG